MRVPVAPTTHWMVAEEDVALNVPNTEWIQYTEQVPVHVTYQPGTYQHIERSTNTWWRSQVVANNLPVDWSAVEELFNPPPTGYTKQQWKAMQVEAGL